MSDLLRKILDGMAGEAQLPGSSIASHMPLLSILAAEAARDADVVELGVGGGWSTIALCHGMSHSSGGDLYSYDTNPECEGLVQAKMKKTDNLMRWTFAREDSVKAASRHDGTSVGLLFIDTDHTLERSRRELEAWLPKISGDGMIAGHDYLLDSFQGTEYGVKQAVSEFYAKNSARFKLQIFPNDCGLYLLRPR